MKKLTLLFALLVMTSMTMVAQENTNLLGLKAPVWEKFANGKDVPLYTSPNENSSKLESIITDEFTIFPVLEENSNWVKVQVIEGSMNGAQYSEAYMKKTDCKIVRPAPITQDVLDYINHRAYRRDYLVQDGKLKGLCFTSRCGQRDNTYVQIGVLDNNRIISANNVVMLSESKKSKNIKISFDKSWDLYRLYYTPKNTFRTGDYEEPGSSGADISLRMFDAKTLTAKQLTDLYNTICKSELETEFVEYYIPELSKDYLFIIRL